MTTARHRGRLELENVARGSPLEAPLSAMLGEAYRHGAAPPAATTSAHGRRPGLFQLLHAGDAHRRARNPAPSRTPGARPEDAQAAAHGGARARDRAAGQGLTVAEVPITAPAPLSAWTAT